MPEPKKSLRQSISLPPRVARRVRALSKANRVSASRVIAQLVESGLEAKEREREQFLRLADRLTRTSDSTEQRRIKEELAHLTFGD